MAKRKTSLSNNLPVSSLEKYLSNIPDKKEIFSFDDHQDAHVFGHKLRENVMKEQNAECWEDCEGIAIDISEKIVRVRIVAREPVCV